MLWRRVSCGGACIVSLAVGVASAQAQDFNRGFYVGGGVGANFQEDNHYTGGGIGSTVHYDQPGAVGVLSFGYAMGPTPLPGTGLRVEIEPGYRYNHVDTINGADGHGRNEIFSLMGNAILDIDTSKYGFNLGVPLIPHVGGGVGVARVWERSLPHNAGLTSTGVDTEPAFQAIGGIDYAVLPNVTVGLDYRYLLVRQAEFHVQSTGLKTKAGDLDNHAVLLTFRYQFGTPAAEPVAAVAPPPPPPAPPAAPAPAPPPLTRNFQVYFALNSATLTPEAKAVVQEAAESAKQNPATRIQVTGHTDTTGTRAYNQRLSVRRATVVRDELLHDGVPAGEIVATGVGIEGLAVPTAAGVNEPRNRRVVIDLGGPGT